MNWIFRRLMRNMIKDFEKAYKERWELERDETMRPDLYWLEKWLDGDFK